MHVEYAVARRQTAQPPRLHGRHPCLRDGGRWAHRLHGGAWQAQARGPSVLGGHLYSFAYGKNVVHGGNRGAQTRGATDARGLPRPRSRVSGVSGAYSLRHTIGLGAG